MGHRPNAQAHGGGQTPIRLRRKGQTAQGLAAFTKPESRGHSVMGDGGLRDDYGVFILTSSRGAK